MVDYQNELREGIFEAFAGILQGLRTDNQADLFLPFAEHVVAFVVDVIFKDETRSEAVTRGAIGALGYFILFNFVLFYVITHLYEGNN